MTLLALLLPFLLVLRRRCSGVVVGFALTFLLVTANGCGDRTLSASSRANLVFPLSVSGTGTNLAGAVLVHATPITLIVQ